MSGLFSGTTLSLMKTLLLSGSLALMAAPVAADNDYLNPLQPVASNQPEYMSDGSMEWRLIFHAVETGTIRLDEIGPVKLEATIRWATPGMPEERCELFLNRHPDVKGLFSAPVQVPGPQSGILNRRPGANRRWEMVTGSVSYEVGGQRHRLPVVAWAFSNVSEASTSLEIIPTAVSTRDYTHIDVRIVGQRQVVKVRGYEIKPQGQNAQAGQLDLECIGQLRLQLPEETTGMGAAYVKITYEVDGTGRPQTVDANVTLKPHLTITQVGTDAGVGNGYAFDLKDLTENTFRITTNGSMPFDPLPANGSYAILFTEVGNGVYDMKVRSNGTPCEDGAALNLCANGIPLQGNWHLKRETIYPEVRLAHLDNQKLNISLVLPEWVKGDAEVSVLNGSDVILKRPLPNSRSVVNGTERIFSVDVGLTDFTDAKSLDEQPTFKGRFITTLGERRLLTQQFELLNMDYFKKKIEEAQTTKTGNARREAIRGVLNELFQKSGDDGDEPLAVSMVRNLSSDDEVRNKTGWEQVLQYALKIAPPLIALI